MSTSAARTTQAFIDTVEARIARLLVENRSFQVPVELLPPDVGEGHWIEIRTKAIPTPDDSPRTDNLRDSLSKDDTSDDLKL